MINYKQSGQKIRIQRHTLGLTQEAIAEKINITPSFYSQIESGTRKAGINTFVAISQELALSLDYILGNEVKSIDKNTFDDIALKIFHHLRTCSKGEKTFILNIIISLEKLIKQ